MSRLIDELNKVGKAISQPIGFRSYSTAAAKTRMLLIASTGKTGAIDSLVGGIEGADAVLMHLSEKEVTETALKKTARTIKKIPWGGWVEGIDTKQALALSGAGGDFMVFLTGSPAIYKDDDKTGRVLQVEPATDDSLLRAVSNLPVDAVLTGVDFQKDDSLAWSSLLQLQRMTNFIAKPLLLTVPAKINAASLRVIWEAGVDGVVVEADTAPAGGLKKLLSLIDKLPARSSQKHGKSEALLPHTGIKSSAPAVDEDEDE